MAFEANAVCFLRSQQMLVVPAMGFVTNRASFAERRLVKMRLLELIRLIRVAG